MKTVAKHRTYTQRRRDSDEISHGETFRRHYRMKMSRNIASHFTCDPSNRKFQCNRAAKNAQTPTHSIDKRTHTQSVGPCSWHQQIATRNTNDIINCKWISFQIPATECTLANILFNKIGGFLIFSVISRISHFVSRSNYNSFQFWHPFA